MRLPAQPPRKASLGWPWWALFVQTLIAGGVLVVLVVTDVVLVVSRMVQSTLATVTSPTEADDGAMGIFGIPILVGIVVGLPTVAIVSGAVLLGLPIRLIAAARVWVVQHWWVPLTCALLGVAVFVGAEVFRPDTWSTPAPFFEPSSVLVGVAMLLVAVGLTNFWRPRKRRPPRAGGPWPGGTLVRVIKDPGCDCPWKQESGTIDGTFVPSVIDHPLAEFGAPVSMYRRHRLFDSE
ncbi:hypothetical protein [Leifsonia sp. Leaf336]|uniref:hypothetical protein n=1 Tax=Leifsonia sp. Leaf336 TaxID=1736341 RepID=UPI0012F82B32|nr:hypothetical protein [Leifsonia sp. Leaf336]